MPERCVTAAADIIASLNPSATRCPCSELVDFLDTAADTASTVLGEMAAASR
jgi:hypothetical protein